MDKDLDLNKPAQLPDGTAASQRGGTEASAADVRRGYSNAADADDRAENFYSAQDSAAEYVDGTPTKPLNDIGGFCGRPQGWQR